MIQVCHLFISAGHNFFGHHGQAAGRHANMEMGQVECVAGRGISGDRFFDFKKDYKGQITFFSMEVLDELRQDLGLLDVKPGDARRNVLVRGVDLRQRVGAEFEIQGVRFLGMEECAPCYWMNTALGPGAEQWLKGRGGLRARILTSGTLRRSSVGTALSKALNSHETQPALGALV